LLHHAAESKRWSETASRLVAGGAGDAALAQYYLMIMRDGERALPLAQNAIRALPNDPDGYAMAGYALGLFGRRSEAVGLLRRATELDAGVSLYWSGLLADLSLLRRVHEVEEVLRGRHNASVGGIMIARFRIAATLPVPGETPAVNLGAEWRWRLREFADVIAAVDASGAVSDEVKLVQLGRKCDALRRSGRTGEAETVAREMIVVAERLQGAPDFGPSPKAGYQAQAWLRTGRTDDALAAARRFIDAVPESNAGTRWTREITLAEMLAYLNRPRECVELVAKLLRVPSGLTVPMLKVDPTWDNVREDAAFKALLADPKNSAPL
jgi:tetratricopeptide (TPR) repeat protein